METYRQLSVETFYYFRTFKLFGYINIPWMMYLWSIQKPPTESKKILGICFTIATLWSYLFQFTTWTLQLSVLNFLSIFISRKVYILAWLNLSLGYGSNFSSLYENRANIPFPYILVVTRVRNPVHGWDLKHIKNNLPLIEPQSSGSRTSLHHISIKGQLKTICLDFLEVFLARTVLNFIWTSWTHYRLNLTVTVMEFPKAS